MGNNENVFSNKESLYDSLVRIRRAGNRNNGNDRAKELRPVINAILGTKTEWNSTQCAVCFQALLKHYITFIKYDDLDLLLAVCGYGEPFSHIKFINSRREEYQKRQDIDILPRSLGKREDLALSEMAEAMFTDYNFEPEKLSSIIKKALEDDKSSDYVHATNTIISNIDLLHSDTFVDRKDIIERLKSNYDNGVSVQALIGANGTGKTFLSLQFARSFSDNYGIICYLDSSDERRQQYSMAAFLWTAGVNFDRKDLLNVKDIFIAYFNSRKDYLIIFDNVHCMDDFTQHLDFSNGHILVVSDDIWAEDNVAYCIINDLNFDNDIQGRYEYFKKELNKNELTKEDKIFISLFDYTCIPYIMSVYYLKTSRWIDSSLYILMLQDYGIYPESRNKSITTLEDAVFNVFLQSLYIKWDYQFDKMADAVRNFLLLNAFFSNCYLDLKLLSTELSILPDSLNEICKYQNSFSQFSDILRCLGFIEIQKSRFLYNSEMALIYENHFHETVFRHNTDTIKERTIRKMMSKIEEIIPTVDNAMQIEYLSQLAYVFEEKCFEVSLDYERFKKHYPHIHQISGYESVSEEFMSIDERIKRKQEKDRRQ